MDTLLIIAGLLAYVVAGRLIMRGLSGGAREAGFALLNLSGVYLFLFHGSHSYYLIRFGVYLALIAGQYVFLRQFASRAGRWPWLAFAAPIAALILFRYVPAEAFRAVVTPLGLSFHGVPNMIGISYLAFRCSRLALEVRNGVVKMPNFAEYVNFAFFLPTMPVGPINSYQNYRRGFDEPYNVPAGRSALRILVGAVKYLFLANLCNKLTYAGLLFNEHPHHWMDLPVAMVFYYLFLYLNFSGFCDMAIGAAALIGIPVPENFENPLAARNMREFWNRWHITLSAWMRDVVFSPLSKFLVGRFGPRMADHAVALTILVVFLLIGIWHGAGLNYALFGLAQALGVATVHYYTIFLKKRLGRDRFKAYNENRLIRAAAVSITFCYYAATLFLFANSLTDMKKLISILQ